jgi:hypothetical protein
MRRALLCVVILLSVGCTTVASTDKILIQDQAAVGVGLLADWDKLTDDQKKQSYWKSTRGYHRLNNTLFGVPVPTDFQNDPWAIKTTRSAPAPVTTTTKAAPGGK